MPFFNSCICTIVRIILLCGRKEIKNRCQDGQDANFYLTFAADNSYDQTSQQQAYIRKLLHCPPQFSQSPSPCPSLPPQYHIEISDMEKQMVGLQESSSLFEVNLPDFKQLKQCRKELKLLKILWDYIMIVRSVHHDCQVRLSIICFRPGL